jgi:hypothetical protein
MEKQKIKTALAVTAVFFCAALVLAGCESPVLDEGQQSGSKTGIRLSASLIPAALDLELAPGAIGVNEITATWTAVAGATAYDVYCDTTATPTTLVYGDETDTTVTITGLTAGTTYYVQVDAKDSTGAIIDQETESCHTSDTFVATHFAEFVPYMDTFGYYYMLDNTNGCHLIYIMSDGSPAYNGYDVSGDIRYIYHFGDNIDVTITDINNIEHYFPNGAAGVIIFESDHAIDDTNWTYTGTGNFTANYYYGGAIENGVYTSVNMGIAATPNSNAPPPYATPCFDTLDEAIAVFSGVEKLEEYIKEPAEYYGM